MEKLSCIYLQKDEAGSSILTFGLQGDFKVSADADSRVKSIPIPYGNGPKGYFDYSGNQPGLSYSQQALVSVPAFGTQPRAYFYCNLLALLSGGNPFMISYKDGVGDVRHTESVFGGTSSDIYSFTACSIHHQYSWNLECYYQSSTYIKSDITALTTDFCTCYLPAQAHRYTPLAPSSGLFARYVGTKAYELKDHLGNVRATVSDCKIGGPLQANMVPELLSASNYYAFGMLMPRRSYQLEDYRFGYGSHEKLDEVSGSGNTIDMGDRWLDVRLGRTPKPDRKADKYPGLSPYSYAANNPIYYTDPNGEELVEVTIKTNSSNIKGELKLIVDKEIAQKVKDLVKYAIDNDINVHFNSSFRSSAAQEGVQKTGTTPAAVGTSRHEGGFGIDFNLYDKEGKMISGNKEVTKETDFIKQAKELGFRWGGEFTTPDKIHIDAWPADEKKKYGYESWDDAYKENQKDYKDKTYESEEYEYNKPAATEVAPEVPATPTTPDEKKPE